MSVPIVRAELEERLAAISPALATEWQNMGYKNADGTPGSPDPKVPYQRVWLLTADPANPEASNGYIEQGFLQVDLLYPLNGGVDAAQVRAELIRSGFKRGSGSKAVIDKTPSISGGARENDRWVVRVKIPFHAQFPRS